VQKRISVLASEVSQEVLQWGSVGQPRVAAWNSFEALGKFTSIEDVRTIDVFIIFEENVVVL
jgi:hypothetical protein